jgi:hypothetical protein
MADHRASQKKAFRYKKESTGFALRLVSAVHRLAGELQLHCKFSGLFLVIRHMD